MSLTIDENDIEEDNNQMIEEDNNQLIEEDNTRTLSLDESAIPLEDTISDPNPESFLSEVLFDYDDNFIDDFPIESYHINKDDIQELKILYNTKSKLGLFYDDGDEIPQNSIQNYKNKKNKNNDIQENENIDEWISYLLPIEWIVDIADESGDWFIATAYTYRDDDDSIFVSVPDKNNPTWSGWLNIHHKILHLIECNDNKSYALYYHILQKSTIKIEWLLEYWDDDGLAWRKKQQENLLKEQNDNDMEEQNQKEQNKKNELQENKKNKNKENDESEEEEINEKKKDKNGCWLRGVGRFLSRLNNEILIETEKWNMITLPIDPSIKLIKCINGRGIKYFDQFISNKLVLFDFISTTTKKIKEKKKLNDNINNEEKIKITPRMDDLLDIMSQLRNIIIESFDERKDIEQKRRLILKQLYEFIYNGDLLEGDSLIETLEEMISSPDALALESAAYRKIRILEQMTEDMHKIPLRKDRNDEIEEEDYINEQDDKVLEEDEALLRMKKEELVEKLRKTWEKENQLRLNVDELMKTCDELRKEREMYGK